MNNITKPNKTSIIVTVCKNETFHTQICLESIRMWKNIYHELIVVSHDETPLLKAYLDNCKQDGLIDILLYCVKDHGHISGFNIGVKHSSSDVVFLICNDIRIGPSIIDECACRLREEPNIGMIGWIWYSKGAFWQKDGTLKYDLRDPNIKFMDEDNYQAIKKAKWYTGKTFTAIGDRTEIKLINTSFFGARKELLQKVGGGFGRDFQHYWADDFLSYSILDQGYDIVGFDEKYYKTKSFFEIQFLYDTIQERAKYRHFDELDDIDCVCSYFYENCDHDLSEKELNYLFLKVRLVSHNANIYIEDDLGLFVWVILLRSLENKKVNFYIKDMDKCLGMIKNEINQFVNWENHLFYEADSSKESHFINLFISKNGQIDEKNISTLLKNNGKVLFLKNNDICKSLNIHNSDFKIIETCDNFSFLDKEIDQRHKYRWEC